jgi:ADP-heptose:LPS heptosyltransferase
VIDPAGLRRIAILRALQLGDLLCAVPAFRALRAWAPSAHTTLIGLPWASAFVQLFPAYLDTFIAFPGWPGLPEQPFRPATIPTFLAEVQAQRFDLALQLHGSGTLTNPLIALLGAAHTAGFAAPGAIVPDPDLFIPYPDDGHEITRLLTLTSRLGSPLSETSLEFPVSHDLGIEIERPFVCVHAGARDPARRWSPDGFAAVADRLAARGLTVVFSGAESDASAARAVQTSMRHPAINLCGQTDLRRLAALLRNACLLVTNDTGISHVAAALQTPSIVVFTCSDPRRWAPLDTGRHRSVLANSSADPVAEVLSHSDELLSVQV